MCGTITVGLVYKPHPDALNINCGRPNILQNPFAMKDKSDAERERVCNEFETYLECNLESKSPNNKIRNELLRIYELVKNGFDVNLQCYCFPKRCHCMTIKEFLDEHIRNWLAN